MKVYEHKGFPNPMRVRVALAEKGLTDRVDFVPVDVTKGEAVIVFGWATADALANGLGHQ